MVSKQDGAVRMPGRVGKQLVNGAGWIEPVANKRGLDVVCGLGDRQGWELKRAGLAIEGTFLLGEEGMHE
jgi:hypothetical protein